MVAHVQAKCDKVTNSAITNLIDILWTNSAKYWIQCVVLRQHYKMKQIRNELQQNHSKLQTHQKMLFYLKSQVAPITSNQPENHNQLVKANRK